MKNNLLALLILFVVIISNVFLIIIINYNFHDNNFTYQKISDEEVDIQSLNLAGYKDYTISEKEVFYVVFFLLIIASAIIIIFKPYAENTNIFMFLGIPKKNSYLGFEYFPIFPWIGIYGIGVIGGRIIYKSKRTLLPFNYLHKEFFSFIGRNGLKAYIRQIPFLFFIVNLIDIIFTKIT